VIAKGPYRKASALLLWTPNCEAQRFRVNYKNLFSYGSEIHIIISKTDPYCSINEVYDSLNRFKWLPTILTVNGDHNFDTGDEKSALNINTVISSSRNFLNLIKK